MKLGLVVDGDLLNLNRTIQELKLGDLVYFNDVIYRLNRTIQELKYGIAIGHAQDFRALIAPYRN